MTEDIDIWRAAHLLVKRHGADATTVAAQRADELLAQGRSGRSEHLEADRKRGA